MTEAIFFSDEAEFRAWLVAHHEGATELFVGFYKKNSDKTGNGYGEPSPTTTGTPSSRASPRTRRRAPARIAPPAATSASSARSASVAALSRARPPNCDSPQPTPMALRKPTKLPTPSNWASLKPFGLGEQKPNNYREVFRAVRENSDNAGYAMRILREGVCDGCALGHQGPRRLDDPRRPPLQRAAAAAAPEHDGPARRRRARRRRGAQPSCAATSCGGSAASRTRCSRARRAATRASGGSAGAGRSTWPPSGSGESGPERAGFFLTSRGMTNEIYYVAQKAARAIGTNTIDNAARHLPLAEHLRAQGRARRRRDDLLLQRLDRHRPDRVLRLQRRQQPAGRDQVPARTPRRRARRSRRSAPTASRAWSGTGSRRRSRARCSGRSSATASSRSTTGGDIGFLTGVLKHLCEQGSLDESFVADRTAGFDELRAGGRGGAVGGARAARRHEPRRDARAGADAGRGRSAACSSGAWA